MASTDQTFDSPHRLQPGGQGDARAVSTAVADPLRWAIADALAIDSATARQLAALLGAEVGRVRNLLRGMRGAGYVTVVGKVPVRGARESVYAIGPTQFTLSHENFAGLPTKDADRHVVSMVRGMYRESAVLLRNAPVGERENLVMRLPMPLDPQGWGEACAVSQEAMEGVTLLREESAERLARAKVEPIERLVIIYFFALAESSTEQAPIERGGAMKPAGDEGTARTPRWQALVDPVRRAVVRGLLLRPSSAVELSTTLELPAEKVRYHLRRLALEGLVEVHGERQTRGTIERVFSLDPRRVAAQEAAQLARAPHARRKVVGPLVTDVAQQILDAVKAGAFRKNPEFVMARIRPRTDSEGDQEIQRILDGATERLLEIRQGSLERLEENGDRPLPVAAALFSFAAEAVTA